MIGEKTKQIVEVVLENPKTSSVVVAGVANLNAQLASYEPVIKFLTGVLGIFLVSILLVKHSIDVYKSLKSDD